MTHSFPETLLHGQMIKVLMLAVLAGMLSAGCEADNLDAPREFFSENKIGASPDYGIMKWGTDHVVTVHGFYDDLEICRTLAAALNRKEPNAYTCQPLNH